MYDISVDARYSLFTGDKFDAYPILGIAVSHTNGFEIGANLGAGVDYELSRSIDLIFNVKYQFAKYYNQALFTIGAGYKF
jgi:opacity protein-like surface antigen